ncbi:TPA: M24 family metallopeptidase [Streptococcus pyogenes]|nr:aminopeptidase P family protein [Streptococcus pyogenes]HES5727388.1 aminopeptidase P family protein [Streptococcus pyogenes]
MSGFLEQRLGHCLRQMAEKGLEALLVTHLTNSYYLTGFSGTAATVLITAKRRVLITDSRYTLLAKASVEGFDIIESRTPLKDASEIETIAKACSISDKAFEDALDFIKPGTTTERDLANFLDFRMRQYGASGTSFDIIVASGYRSAMPHGRASDKVIQNKESLTMDFGCYYNHYVSDMTRTIHIGQVTDEEREIYALVLAANKALIAKASAGMTYSDFDGIPRQLITEAGYGSHFTHGIGHGIGLDIHENPFFGKSEQLLQAGMVVTDEPGIYLDNKYGVRIEDDLVITETGCQVLTLAPKELIVL